MLPLFGIILLSIASCVVMVVAIALSRKFLGMVFPIREYVGWRFSFFAKWIVSIFLGELALIPVVIAYMMPIIEIMDRHPIQDEHYEQWLMMPFFILGLAYLMNLIFYPFTLQHNSRAPGELNAVKHVELTQ